MTTKTIRQDFEFSSGHPGDQSIDYDWGIQTMMVFRRNASQQTLGRDFLGTEYDDDSPTHLIVSFKGGTSVNLVSLSAAVTRLKNASSDAANKEFSLFTERHPGAAIRTYARFSLADANRLPPQGRWDDTGVSLVSEDGDPNVRRALLRWIRDTAWRLHPDGYVRSVFWSNHPESAIPAVASCNFNAPFPNRDAGPSEALIGRYQQALGLELARLSRGHASTTPPTPWP